MMRKKIVPPKSPTLLDIIGKKAVSLKGFRTDMRNKKGFPIVYILFDDGETYIELEDQDYYTYHDCNGSAKLIKIFKDKRVWEMIMSDAKHYPDADIDPMWY
jgi:hypothetical protein